MRVLYTGAFRFPDGDAAAFRVLAVGAILRRLGCDVTFAGWEHRSGAPAYQYDGYDCHAQAEFRDADVGVVARVTGFLFRGRRTLRWLETQPPFDMIIAYNPPAWFARKLQRWGGAHDTAIVLDSTEWYESEHLPGGRFGLAAAENRLRMTVVYPGFRHVIAISSLLESHFAGRNVVRIPPLLPDTTTSAPTSARPSPAEGVRLVYAGQAGRKDRLGALLAVLPTLAGQAGVAVTLTIAGMTWPELQALCATDGVDAASLASVVTCLGRVSREEVAALYAGSHVAVLFREDRRYARAGFPTKAMEAWAAGCVILANAVGDFGRLATDGADALLLEETALADSLGARLKALCEPGRFDAMSAQASATAQRLFAPAAYEPAVQAFLATVRGEARARP